MFKKKLEFIIKSKCGTTIEEILTVIETIKKVHPSAKIYVEVEV